eukprot:TRINITY_DN11112_c0_g1_i1.p1 TRINITY_DN11112_c0_g1~~TRINITY_DN11112_c0_g1_i1.p1  ORF type:complete len:285 (-),score=57.98 TRINITY_DN11112_c0_g1_i1:186-935(-)
MTSTHESSSIDKSAEESRQQTPVSTKRWKLYQFEQSPFCDKIRRVLNYKGVQYDIEEVGLMSNLKKIHPQGKVPVLEIEDGTRIADSTDIALFIEKRYPEPPLYPRNARDKALAHIVEDWADESLFFYEMRLRFVLGKNKEKWIPELTKNSNALVKMSLPLVLPSVFSGILDKQGLGRKNDEEFLANVEKQIVAANDLLEDRKWFIGDHMTVADIAVFVQLQCFAGAPEALTIMERYPNLMNWMHRVNG